MKIDRRVVLRQESADFAGPARFLASTRPSSRHGPGQGNLVVNEKATTFRDGINSKILSTLTNLGETYATKNFCLAIKGGSKFADLESLSWNWYLAYLHERSKSSWQDIMLPVLPRGA